MCDPAFALVREAFLANFTDRGETGAALCVVIDGRVVVDLWNGWADEARTRPWRPDTLVDVFSVGKGLAAICAARLAGEGRLDVDAPVAAYWPEFAAGGKDTITVRQVLSHQAGLPAVRQSLPKGSVFEWRTMTEALAVQEPWWPPGSAHGYHVNTFGFLVGELVRRTDGRTIGRFFRDEIAGPLDADVHIGLPSSEDHRVAEFIVTVAAPDPPPTDGLMWWNAYFNPPELSGMGVVNSRAWRGAEIPSANGHGNARGIARVYAGLREVVTKSALLSATSEQVHGADVILGRPSRFGLGFQLTQPERPLGPGPHAFGHFGAGGSLGFCDPDTGLAFGYVMNQMGPRWQNPRNRALIDAVYACL